MRADAIGGEMNGRAILSIELMRVVFEGERVGAMLHVVINPGLPGAYAREVMLERERPLHVLGRLISDDEMTELVNASYAEAQLAITKAGGST